MMMKIDKRSLMALICLLAILPTSGHSFSQDGKLALKTSLQAELNLFSGGSFKLFGAKYFGKVVKGAPYSALATSEHVQTLTDGNRIVRRTEAKIYRDGQGRTRIDQKLESIGQWIAAGDAPQLSYINDPVKGVTYNLNPSTRTAVKSATFKYAPPGQNRNVNQEKRLEAQEERLREQERHIREQEVRNREQSREREARAKERAMEIEKRAKNRAMEN
jgi:hypothetical protein